MDERHLNEALLKAFPELAHELEEFVSWQDGMDTGAFLTYEDIFRPHLERAIKEGDEAFLNRASGFIEELLLSGDEYAVNVMVVGILEGLKANCDNDAVRKILRSRSLKEFDSLTY